MRISFRLILPLLALVFACSALFGAGRAQAASYYPGNVQYTHAELVSIFQNSGNSYLASNATSFANMAINVESGGNTAIYNGTCCTGLMQMNKANLKEFCGCTSQEYAAMNGQQQIAIYSKYMDQAAGSSAVKQLQALQAQGGSINGQKVDGAMIAACIQLGAGNCAKSIGNNCSGVSRAEGGDGYNNICTMAKGANGGSTGGGGGGGSCLSAHPVDSPVVFSEYGAWGRPGAGANNGWHRGSDIYPKGAQGQSSKGEPLYAAHQGKLTTGSMGLKVESGQFRTLYLHSGSRPEVKDVSPGEEIGKIGDVKSAGKPHLHFEVQVPKSAVSSTKCVIGTSTDDCAFPVGGGKRDPNGFATSDSLAAAAPNAWFYVNPERYFKEQVPVVGMAAVRAGRSQSLPNTCTPGTDIGETPTSSGDSDTSFATAGGEGTYNASSGSAIANADSDMRSIAIDMTKQSALEVRALSSPAANLSGRMDNSLVHMLILLSRSGG